MIISRGSSFNSPDRVVRLNDGSKAFPTGSIVYIGSVIPVGKYTVEEIRFGLVTNDIFIGVSYNDRIYRMQDKEWIGAND